MGLDIILVLLNEYSYKDMVCVCTCFDQYLLYYWSDKIDAVYNGFNKSFQKVWKDFMLNSHQYKEINFNNPLKEQQQQQQQNKLLSNFC